MPLHVANSTECLPARFFLEGKHSAHAVSVSAQGAAHEAARKQGNAHHERAADALPIEDHAQEDPIVLLCVPVGPRHKDELLAEAAVSRAPALHLTSLHIQAREQLQHSSQQSSALTARQHIGGLPADIPDSSQSEIQSASENSCAAMQHPRDINSCSMYSAASVSLWSSHSVHATWHQNSM